MGLALAAALVTVPPAQAQTFGVLYSFTGGAEGTFPAAPLVRDSAGNLYGTTSDMPPPPVSGDAAGGNPGSYGAVFKIDTTGAETTLHSFAGVPDGATPLAGLVRDAAGNLYGTTELGGDATCNSGSGCGTVFRIDITGTERVLYSFHGGADGADPMAALVEDSAGNLYGTTYFGGDPGCGDGYGCGTVFKLSATGTETVLYRFTGGTHGEYPAASLIRDATGNFYGTTLSGGADSYGTVFKVSETGEGKVLYSFTGGADGADPVAALVTDGAGNVYGTTQLGGAYGNGVVFQVDAAGTENVLHSFRGGTDGAVPFAAVVRDPAGNLYGTTFFGGETLCESGCGTVFELTASGVETILHTFTGRSDGGYPRAALIRDGAGNLYGTAGIGGSHGAGMVFKVHQKRLLDQGKIERLVAVLCSLQSDSPEVTEKIRTEADYLERNAERMRYPKFRRQHPFIGSGVIEAGCTTVIGSGLKRSGMFWSVRGANAILALRCCHLNGRFENYWEGRRTA